MIPPNSRRNGRPRQRGGKFRIDYVGIALIAIGFACLEVVLDRGERDDWLESHFIATFLAIAVVAIAARDLVGMASRRSGGRVDPAARAKFRDLPTSTTFCLRFGLFGSTVLIPEMLQTLFGYTATDAGLVLGPGAAVITLLAPFVVRIVPRIGAKRLLGASFTIAALSFFYYSGLTTADRLFHFALARCFQGFGYAFMFVPVTQLAYSYLPRNKNNKGSSLTNLCRNWGGSFGIAFVTTMLERRTQYHQSVLVSNLTSADGTVQQFVSSFEPLPGDARSEHSGRHPSGIWTDRKPDDPAGDDAGIHGLFSPVRPDGAYGPAAGVSHQVLRDWQSGRRGSLKVREIKEMLNVTPGTDGGSSKGIGQEDFPAPIGKLLGLKLSTPADGRATVEFEATERYANPMGTLHGGVLCDVADAAMGAAYRSTLTDGESFTTLELKINFLRPVWKAKLRAEAGMVRAGKIVGLVECDIFDEQRAAGGARVEHLYDAARRTRGRPPATS